MAHQLIIAIVDKGKDIDVMNIAKAQGARGGTIMVGKGASVFEKKKLSGLNIDPEKEMVMIMTTEEKSKSIMQAISEAMQMDKPNTGVIFTLATEDVMGVIKE